MGVGESGGKGALWMIGEWEIEIGVVADEEVVTSMVGRVGRSLKGGWKDGVVD